jgi:hypothetical protein
VWGDAGPPPPGPGARPLPVPGDPSWVCLRSEAPTLRATPTVVAGTGGPGGAACAAAGPMTVTAVAPVTVARAGAAATVAPA